MPKFSICLIARNEVKTLPRLMGSLKEFQARGGEVVLVDTGSKDGTADLARSLGCKVTEVGEAYLHTIDKELADNINHRFIVDGEETVLVPGDKYFDFAAARNYAASLASNDMVSFMDADEEATHFDIDAIDKLIEQGNEQFEYNFVFSHGPFGEEVIKFIQSKFYDRRKIKWVGIVHEVLSGHGKRALLGESIYKLEHWQNFESNRHSYIVGLAVDCYMNPQNDRNSHYFARELLWSNRPKSCIKEFERHVAMKAWKEEMAQSIIFMGDAYGQLNQPDKQAECYYRAFHIDPSRREALMRLARFYQHNNCPQAVAPIVKAAMEIPWSPFYANCATHYTNEPEELLFWAYGWLGNVPEAQKHIMKALEFQPDNPAYLDQTKFYFEYPANNIPGWMKFDELKFLYETAKKVHNICEVGSWRGRSTHALLSGCRGEVTAVDTFEGSTSPLDKTNKLYKPEDNFEIFKKNVGHFPNLRIVRADSLKTAKDYPDKAFDFVFIDAGHTYEEVKADIEAWLSKARLMIAGHDYCQEWPDVIRAVDESLGVIDGKGGYSIWYKYLAPRVSFIIPQLGRPEGLQRCIDSIKKLNYPQKQIDIQIIHGDKTVPQKVKQGVEHSTGEYLVYAANDCEFEPDSLYLAIKESQDTGKRLVAFDTGVRNSEGYICEHFMIKRDLIPLIGGEVFDTSFWHVGVDDLLWKKCDKLGEAMVSQGKVIHHHFSRLGSGVEKDAIIEKGWAHQAEDRELLKTKLAALNA